MASPDPRAASARARLPTIRTLVVLAAASDIPEYRIGPQKGEPVHRTLRPAPGLSQNAGSATRAVAGQQKLIQAKTDRRNWLLGHAPNPHRDWSRTAQTAKYPLLKRSTRTHF